MKCDCEFPFSERKGELWWHAILKTVDERWLGTVAGWSACCFEKWCLNILNSLMAAFTLKNKGTCWKSLVFQTKQHQVRVHLHVDAIQTLFLRNNCDFGCYLKNELWLSLCVQLPVTGFWCKNLSFLSIIKAGLVRWGARSHIFHESFIKSPFGQKIIPHRSPASSSWVQALLHSSFPQTLATALSVFIVCVQQVQVSMAFLLTQL